MRIAIIGSGSRGDVQPYIALGKGLVQAGHAVRFVTHHNYKPLVSAHGLEFWPVEGDVQAVAQWGRIPIYLNKSNLGSLIRFFIASFAVLRFMVYG